MCSMFQIILKFLSVKKNKKKGNHDEYWCGLCGAFSPSSKSTGVESHRGHPSHYFNILHIIALKKNLNPKQIIKY